MSEIKLLCGKIASGKTTFAKQWCIQHPHTILLSVDELMLAVQDTCPGRSAHVRMEQGILHYFYQLSEQLLREGCDVIIDHGYWLRKEREEAYAYYRQRGITVKLHYLPIAEAEQKRRIDMRKQNPHKNRYDDMDEDKMHYLNTFFESLSEQDMHVLAHQPFPLKEKSK